MMSTTQHGETRLSSPDLIDSSDDELFNPLHKPHETVDTVPLKRANANDENESAFDTLATLPVEPSKTQTQSNTGRLTQPTQIIRRSPPLVASSPYNSAIQVAASSPIPTPAPTRKGYLANAMAPAGTAFRRPFVPLQPRPQPITIDSDDDGPKYKGGSSDDDREDLRKSDIKTTIFQRTKPMSETIPESPLKGNSLFKSITANAYYSSLTNGVKRSADSMAEAYGNVYKKSKQTGPSRAMPIREPTPESEMEEEDIQDPGLRRNVHRMRDYLHSSSVRECYNALLYKKGNFEDAVDYALLMSDRKQKKNSSKIDLTGSDDELMPTPAGPRKLTQAPVKQQAKVATQSIREKYGGTQIERKLAPAPAKKFDVFDQPIKKSRTLVRGRKERSSPAAEESRPRSHIGSGRPIELSDSDEADSEQSTPEDTSFEFRLLDFFNKCTAGDLADTAAIKHELAEHVLSKRPFKTRAAIEKVENPDLKPTKGKRRTAPIGIKIADKVEEMLESYEAVDYLVKQCDGMSKPLEEEMRSWGVETAGKDELNLVSLHDSQNSHHDSGIGTPMSDDEVRKPGKKSFLDQPSIMNHDYKMKDYQIVGMNWLNLLYKCKLSGILADDMGLGKTYQVIAFLAHLLETNEKGPHLIVVPAATLENWLKEFQRFCPRLRVEAYYAPNPDERAIIRDELDEEHDNINVIVTTYHVAKAKEDYPWLREYGFCCTVFDEGHTLKNADTIASQRMVKIKSKFRLLLTGTPLQNNLQELISLLGFIMPKLFSEKHNELKAIFNHKVKAMDEDHEALLSAQRIARARAMLTPFILRRKKVQVLKDLPVKHRRVEWCELTPEQAELYNFWLSRALKIRERRERGELLKDGESTHVLMKLRQASMHPLLSRRIYTDDLLPKIAKQCLKDEMWRESNPNLIVRELLEYSDMEIHKLCSEHPVLDRFALRDNEWLASGKIQKMLELLRQWRAEGAYTLIFSQFVMLLDILELVLEKENITYFRLDGSTKVSERQDLIDEFSKPENETPVFMLSTKAGGAGINLAKANKVIVFDSGFNPQDDIQAENRAHRIGQDKEVEVVRLIVRDTVEEQIWRVGEVKVRLDEEVAGQSMADTVANGLGGTSGTATPMEDEVGAAKGKGKKNAADMETEAEKKGRKEVEELFFQKLKEQGNKIKVEPKSPSRPKKTALKVEVESQKKHGSDEELEVKVGKDDLDAGDDNSNKEASVEKVEAEVKHEDEQEIDTPKRPRRAGTKKGRSTKKK